MYRKAFIDTSAWLAYSLVGEPDHQRMKKLIAELLNSHVALFTSNDIIDETVTRLVYQTSPSVTARFIGYIKDSISRRLLVQLWTDEQNQAEAFAFIEKFSDQKLSLTDATSTMLIKRYNIDVVVTLDSDFAKIGLRVLP